MFKPGLGTLKGYKSKIIYIIVEARPATDSFLHKACTAL